MSSDEKVGELAGRVAHAMRTPIGVVKGVLDQLKTPATPDRERLLEFAERSLAQMARLADRLSLLGEIERGLEPGRQSTKLRGLVEEAIDAVARTRRRKGVEVTFADAGGDASIVCNPNLLRAAFAELIDNGVRFARSRVTIELDAAAGVIDIANDGPTVEPSAITGLQGTRPLAADRAGLGLGLWIASRIVAAHGGSIEHRPAGDGARFCVLTRRSSG